MRVHVITLFPELVEFYAGLSLIGKAREKGLIEVSATQLRDWACDKHRTVDDTPYGGGAGMILKPDVLAAAIDDVAGAPGTPGRMPVVFTTPRGRKFDSALARKYGETPEWTVVCGHYGGIDARVVESRATDEISIGDFVLMGGELAALAMIEAAARFVPGALGNAESAETDTFEDSLLGPPLYTRPPEFEGMAVPEELISGHHAKIAEWRRLKSLETTFRRRPDLLEGAELSDNDARFIESLKCSGNE